MSESQRVDFIRSIDGYESINPYLDHSKVYDIKKALYEAGFYKNELWTIKESSIINLIRKAQSKKPIRIMKSKTTKRDKRKRVYLEEQ